MTVVVIFIVIPLLVFPLESDIYFIMNAKVDLGGLGWKCYEIRL